MTIKKKQTILLNRETVPKLKTQESLPNQEIDRIVAEVILGWRLHTQRAVSGIFAHNLKATYQVWKNPNGEDAVMVDDWSPTTKLADAWQIVEKLQDRFWFELKSPFAAGEKWIAGYTVHGATGWNGRPDFSGAGETAPLAICRAALAAIAIGKVQQTGKTINRKQKTQGK